MSCPTRSLVLFMNRKAFNAFVRKENKWFSGCIEDEPEKEGAAHIVSSSPSLSSFVPGACFPLLNIDIFLRLLSTWSLLGKSHQLQQ